MNIKTFWELRLSGLWGKNTLLIILFLGGSFNAVAGLCKPEVSRDVTSADMLNAAEACVMDSFAAASALGDKNSQDTVRDALLMINNARYAFNRILSISIADRMQGEKTIFQEITKVTENLRAAVHSKKADLEKIKLQITLADRVVDDLKIRKNAPKVLSYTPLFLNTTTEKKFVTFRFKTKGFQSVDAIRLIEPIGGHVFGVAYTNSGELFSSIPKSVLTNKADSARVKNLQLETVSDGIKHRYSILVAAPPEKMAEYSLSYSATTSSTAEQKRVRRHIKRIESDLTSSTKKVVKLCADKGYRIDHKTGYKKEVFDSKNGRFGKVYKLNDSCIAAEIVAEPYNAPSALDFAAKGFIKSAVCFTQYKQNEKPKLKTVTGTMQWNDVIELTSSVESFELKVQYADGVNKTLKFPESYSDGRYITTEIKEGSGNIVIRSSDYLSRLKSQRS